MRFYCTYFDSRYLLKGLALYRSLLRHERQFRLWVLCFDNQTYNILCKLAFPEIVPISLEEFEKDDTELVAVKRDRTTVEYYFTCTPSLPLFVFRKNPEVGLITYLDADLFFFSDAGPIFEEFKGNSILIIGHKFPDYLKHLDANGIYNVGLLSFVRDEQGLACLRWWRDQCIRWCYDRQEEGHYADQKFLDDWPIRFERVCDLRHKGANVAPWNIMNYRLSLQNEQVFIDDQPLLVYHFQGLTKVAGLLYDSSIRNNQSRLSRIAMRNIYAPYIEELYAVQRGVSDIADISREKVATTRYPINMFMINKYKLSIICDILMGRFLFVKGGILV
ncbi:MAG: family 2 glycosyl transferase [Nitrospirae bacterium]|nr:MAG: family 2 glycosyl transferase [Nitrospirota bacterium]